MTGFAISMSIDAMKFLKIASFILLFAAAILVSLVSCRGKGEVPVEGIADLDTTAVDSTVTDSICEEVEVVPAKKADELFDDFVFAFMKNRYFQKQRIVFPLPCTINGQTHTIASKDWTFDQMYSQYEIYTLIFDSMKAEKAAKDTTLRQVVVEELNLDTKRAKSYKFKRNDGEWRLTSITDEEMGVSTNSDFYLFYHKFATDREYQRQHITQPLAFSTFDDDTFETIEGVIAPEQFEEFSPELPTTNITNILYGQTFNNSNLRVLSLRALAGGMESSLVFKKTDGEWMLTRLEN